MAKIRKYVTELSVVDCLSRENAVDTMVSYFDRQSDHALIKNRIKVKYGQVITKEIDPNKPDSQIYRFYYAPISKEKFSAEVDAGLISVISWGFGHKVCGALANLFTEYGHRLSLAHETIDDVTEFSDYLEHYRTEAGFNDALTLWDRRSIQCGTSVLFISFADGRLSYQVLTPADIRVFYAGEIEVDGIRGFPDNRDIEDASAVVIRLAPVGVLSYRYLAIVPRCDKFPKGRYVTYEASSLHTQIPAVGTEGAIDFEIAGAVCNPLTYVADQYPDLYIPEFPLLPLHSNLTASGEVLPWFTTLYNDSVELDMAASHLLDTGQDEARGTNVLERDHNGVSQPLPSSLRGDLALFPGQTLTSLSQDTSAITGMFEMLEKLTTHVGEGYYVPDYLLIPENQSSDKSSGIALELKTRPMVQFRNNRINRNRSNVMKIFDVESALLTLFDVNAPSMLIDLLQTWEPGELKIPESRKDQIERLTAAKREGVIDTIELIRDYYRCTSEDEAIDRYEQLKARSKKYPSLVSDPKKQLGLKGFGSGNLSN